MGIIMERIYYFLKEGAKNIWTNGLMSFASISVLTICLFFLGMTFMISENINSLIYQVEGQIQIMVFVKDGTSAQDIQKINDGISAVQNVRNCTFIPKAEALSTLKTQWGSDSTLLEGLENDNPLLDAFRIEIKDVSKYKQTVESISAISGIEKVNDHLDLAQKLTDINKIIQVVGFWIFVTLAFVSLFIISNTIKLAMYVRKREVNIMKFVGATDWFIRWPFIIEGLIIGVVSSILSAVIVWVAYSFISSWLDAALSLVHPIVLDMFIYPIILAFLIAGTLVGTLGSMVSVRKYLKV